MATEQELFDFYQGTFKLIYADLVATYGEKPQEIIFELEACLSHFGVAKTTKNPAIAKDNIDKAYGHIQRATLDAVKLLWVTLKSRAEEIISDEQIRKYCCNCSEGKLLEKYNHAEDLVIKARRNEVQNTGISPNSSIDDWYKAVLEFKEFLDLVDYDKVQSFKVFSWRHMFQQHSMGFLAGVVSSTLVAFVFWKFFPTPTQPEAPPVAASSISAAQAATANKIRVLLPEKVAR